MRTLESARSGDAAVRYGAVLACIFNDQGQLTEIDGCEVRVVEVEAVSKSDVPVSVLVLVDEAGLSKLTRAGSANGESQVAEGNAERFDLFGDSRRVHVLPGGSSYARFLIVKTLEKYCVDEKPNEEAKARALRDAFHPTAMTLLKTIWRDAIPSPLIVARSRQPTEKELEELRPELAEELKTKLTRQLCSKSGLVSPKTAIPTAVRRKKTQTGL